MAADESFNLDSLLDDIDQVVVEEHKGGFDHGHHHIPHPPPRAKSPCTNPKHRFAVNPDHTPALSPRTRYSTSPVPTSNGQSSRQVQGTNSTNGDRKERTGGGRSGGDDNSLDNLLDMLDTPTLTGEQRQQRKQQPSNLNPQYYNNTTTTSSSTTTPTVGAIAAADGKSSMFQQFSPSARKTSGYSNNSNGSELIFSPERAKSGQDHFAQLGFSNKLSGFQHEDDRKTQSSMKPHSQSGNGAESNDQNSVSHVGSDFDSPSESGSTIQNEHASSSISSSSTPFSLSRPDSGVSGNSTTANNVHTNNSNNNNSSSGSSGFGSGMDAYRTRNANSQHNDSHNKFPALAPSPHNHTNAPSGKLYAQGSGNGHNGGGNNVSEKDHKMGIGSGSSSGAGGVGATQMYGPSSNGSSSGSGSRSHVYYSKDSNAAMAPEQVTAFSFTAAAISASSGRSASSHDSSSSISSASCKLPAAATYSPSNSSGTGPKSRCSKVVLAGTATARGRKSSAFSQVACDNLRCLKCNFRVHCFAGCSWDSSIDYMFLRNTVPNETKLSSKLLKSTETYAYCCQCTSADESAERQLTQGATNDPQWICAGH